jgi:SAM-dependent methyltransferase
MTSRSARRSRGVAARGLAFHWLTGAILVEDDGVRGYDDQSYGDGFADVYDDWYADISDVAATTSTLKALADGGRVLELGIGTGRLAIPLAAAGVPVVGVDSSPAMLDRLREKPGVDDIDATLGDMVDGLPAGPFSLVFVAYNTFFNLLTEERQQACFVAVEERLQPGGAFAIEAFVPDPAHEPASSVNVRSVLADRVVLSVSTADPAAQRAEGQYIDITEAGGVRLRPWSIRWATPGQLDEMASSAGLRLESRWGGFDRSPFDVDSARHVSVYRLGDG